MKNTSISQRITALLRQTKATRGFTLIEMAIVLVIVGIIVSIVASVLPSLIQTAKAKKAQAILKKADNALQGYSIVNHRLPCADSSTDGNEDTGIYEGNLPFRTLGLSAGTDAWENAIKYAVYEDLTTTTGSNFCTTLNGITSYNDTSKVHTTDEDTGEITNQAYVVVSGGAKDLDGDSADGFFDGFNEGSDVQFDDTNKIEFHGNPVNTRYDDLMRAFSLTELVQTNCTSHTTGDDDTTSEICDNGKDDDGDDYIDCDDQDCYGVDPCGPGGANVVITTSSIPPGELNDDYSVTFQATGGTTPYEWELTSDGGFTDFFLHTYTGKLSGTLDQCPGTYTIGVEVEDSTLSADGGPKTATRSFDLEVTTDLSISRTSGSGTNITWDSPAQQETFTTNDSHLGDIQWSLDTGGAGGFTVSSTGSDTCVVKKNGSTIANTYNFSLTATDSSCSGNTDQLIFQVTVEGGATGAPYSVDLIAEWRMDECSWDGTEGEVLDSEGALHGTAQNGADTIGSGKICSAASFTASSHGIEIPDNSSIDFTGNDWSVCFWYKMMENSSGGWDQIFVKGNGSRRNYAMWLRPNSGKIHFRVDPSNQGLDSNAAMISGTWYFITGVYDSSTLKLYINATLDKSASGISMNTNGDNDDPLYIGKSPGYNTIDAKVDEFMLYSKALSEEEITTLYSLTHTCSGTCYTDPVAVYYMDESNWDDGGANQVRDSSGNNYHGTPYGSAAINTTDSHIGYAGEFSNSDSYIAITGLPVSTTSGDQTTVTFWMKWLGGNSEMPIGWTSYDLWFYSDYFGFNTSGGDIYGISNASSTLEDEWHHIAAVFTNSGTAQNALFIDGKEQSLSLLRGSQNNRTVGSNFRISGWTNNSGYRFDGLIDELRIYDRGLSASEVGVDKDLTH
ncbi:MAG: hypothetical protein BBJ60_12580 [Desulfobacterales bacterium S7086C20]|nr:MAG: hypothetical protein BBJ60_12580 [Desulfobacterales bacterium S7086C20]